MRRYFNFGVMKNISIPNIFLVLALFFGMLYSFLTPPFQVADEIAHFYRAYQVSEGNFKAMKLNDRLGGYIPRSLSQFASQYKKLINNTHCKLRYDYILNSKKITLQPKDIIFTDFPNTALYSPVSYVPQSITMFFLRLFRCSPFYLLYVSRLTTLFFWIFLMYLSIRIIPVQKLLFAFLALLPMSISTGSSLSADVVTNGLSFFLIAYILRIAFSNSNFTKKDFLIIFIVIISLGMAKLIYVALLLLLFIIPLSKFKSIKEYLLIVLSFFILGIGSSVIWARNINQLYIPYSNYNKVFKVNILLSSDADMNKQIEFIKNDDKMHLVKIFTNSYCNEFTGLVKEYIGELGWGDTHLPDWLIIIYYFIIFSLSIGASHEKINFNILQRALFLVTGLLITGLIMLSQYLTYNPVGSDMVGPLQGRYFIPVFPLIFIVLYNKKISFQYKYLKNPLILLTLFLGTYSFLVLFNRCYINYETEKKWELFSNPDQLENNNQIYLFDNRDTLVMRDPIIPSSENPHSGKYSVKLTSLNQFGFTHKIYNAKKGDLLKLSFWRNGNSGYLVISENVTNGFYYGILQAVKAEPSGWKYFESEFIVPKDLNRSELVVYIWNDKPENTYFDDFKISYYRKK
jgi:uncharacterized membrane protein